MYSELDVNHCVYKRKFPNFAKPKIIGYIGLQNLKFCKNIADSKVNYNLNHLLEEAIHRPQNLDVKLTDLLSFLIEHWMRLHLHNANNLDEAYIFCYRGLMTCIACTPYENQEPWKIIVILHNGNIYLCARDTEEKINRINRMSDRERRCASWGYKFEQFVLSDHPDEPPNPNNPVDENEEFSLVFTTNINSHKIIYGAEMDGIRCDKFSVSAKPYDEDPKSVIEYLSSKEYIELKTSRHLEFANQEKNFRKFKAKKWWCQSFLVGVDTILCGFRNDEGIVEELKVMPIKNLVKISQKFWDPNVCFNFLDTFLTYVKRCLAIEIQRKFGHEALKHTQNLPLIAIQLEWRPGMPVRMNPNYKHEEDQILPDWFLNFRTNSTKL